MKYDTIVSTKYMRKFHALILLLVVSIIGVLWGLLSFLYEHYPIVNYPPQGTRIIAFGDSLTEGVGASSKASGYVPILEERLGVTIINKGVRSDTTRQALRRLETDVLAENPDIVLVLLGGNDFLVKIPKEEVFRNLLMMITRIQANGGVVILLGIQGGILGDTYADDFERLARDTGSAYVPNVLDGIIGDSARMTDAVHPNDKGYMYMADKIAPTLEGIILGARNSQDARIRE